MAATIHEVEEDDAPGPLPVADAAMATTGREVEEELQDLLPVAVARRDAQGLAAHTVDQSHGILICSNY
jgi:hypothetical protein